MTSPTFLHNGKFYLKDFENKDLQWLAEEKLLRNEIKIRCDKHKNEYFNVHK